MELTVAVIGPAHALRGAVRLDVRTDDPEARLARGTVLATDPPESGPLTLADLRRAGSAWVARFQEITDRAAAEALRGTALVVDTGDLPAEEDAWYPHELVGLAVHGTDGDVLGTVRAVEHPPAHDVLVVSTTAGAEVRVPFVRAIVPEVDVTSARVVVDPPAGLFPLPGDAPDGAGRDED